MKQPASCIWQIGESYRGHSLPVLQCYGTQTEEQGVHRLLNMAHSSNSLEHLQKHAEIMQSSISGEVHI